MIYSIHILVFMVIRKGSIILLIKNLVYCIVDYFIVESVDNLSLSLFSNVPENMIILRHFNKNGE